MSVFSIPVICYYNGDILRTETYVKYVGNKAFIAPLDILADCMFEQLGDIIFSSTIIDKQKFKLVLNCKYPLKSGNRFQPFPIWNDSTEHRMLNMVNTTAIDEIELFVEVVRINRQANQSMGVAENENVAEIDYGCGPSNGPVLDTGVYGDDDVCAYEEGNDESDEDVDDEYDEDLHVQADGHVYLRKGYLYLHMHYLVMYRISQMMRDQMSHPLFIFTYHQHLVLNMLKT